MVLRTAWVYSLRTDSLFMKVLGLARKQEMRRIVQDQVSHPTWARSLVGATVRILSMAMAAGQGTGERKAEATLRWIGSHAGFNHLAGNGDASRLEWAKQILAISRRECMGGDLIARTLIGAKTADLPAPVKRPLLSAPDCCRFEMTFGFRLEPWREALRSALTEAE